MSVMATPVMPLRSTEYFTAIVSNQPQRRGRRVVVPYSLPRSRMYWPVAFSCSVGKGPPPTRVLYAFMMPKKFFTVFGGTPAPVYRPSAEQELLVTYG